MDALGDELRERLSARGWSAGRHHYDYTQSYRFCEDGTGEIWFGYAQAMRLEAGFRYRIVGLGEVEFECDGPYLGGQRVRVRCAVDAGEFPVTVARMGDDLLTTAGFRLRLMPDPFEDWMEPFERNMPYFGGIAWPEGETELESDPAE